MALGDNEPGLDALALENCIGGGGGAMVDVVELAVPAVALLEQFPDLVHALLDSNALVGDVGGDLCADGLALGRNDADVCEGALSDGSQRGFWRAPGWEIRTPTSTPSRYPLAVEAMSLSGIAAARHQAGGRQLKYRAAIQDAGDVGGGCELSASRRTHGCSADRTYLHRQLQLHNGLSRRARRRDARHRAARDKTR